MSGSDRTEKPTPKRKREARREGRIARSPELTGWAATFVAASLLPMTFGRASTSITRLWQDVGRAIADPQQSRMFSVFHEGGMAVLSTVLPLAVVLMVVGVAGSLAQVGFAASGSILKPKASRISPKAGLKRLLSPQSAWDAAKALLKLVVLSALAWRSLTGFVPRLVDAGRLSTAEVLKALVPAALGFVRDVSMAALVLAAADYAFQRRRINKGMAMTKQEVKEEHRQSDGDPLVKGAIRSRQMRIARQRMMADVKSADAVLVNPTHIAVALRYRAGTGAPRVVAKGAGAVAMRIRSEAEAHDVPIVRDVPLARALHKTCDIGDEIPADLYEAVARLLAFIFGLRTLPRSLVHGTIHELPAA